MSGFPKITIGILSYNAEKSIGKAIQSAFQQDWQNCEIIIVDDASTDRSRDIIHELIRGKENAKLIIHDENKGAGCARNTVLQHASGEFVAFFDDDDESLPERIRMQYKRIVSYEEEHKDVKLIACYASGERVYPNGYVYPLRAIGSELKIPHGEGVADRLLYYGGDKQWFFGSGTPTCSLMARKLVFEQVGGFDPELRRVQDVDLAIRIALKGGHFIGCPEKLFVQYATDGADKSFERKRDSSLILVDKYKEYLQRKGMYRYAKTWPHVRYYNFSRKYGAMFVTLLYLAMFYPLRVVKHLLSTGPARILHERKMSA